MANTQDKINNWTLTTKSLVKMSKKQDAHRKRMWSPNLHKGLQDKQRQESIEQEQIIGYWVREKGLKHRDFVGHPAIDDLILLINIRDAMWDKFSKSHQAVWGAYWNTVYHKRRKLKKKALNKFETIITDAENIYNQRQQELQKIRNRIKEARQNPKPNQRDDDMMAKASLTVNSVPWEL